MNKFSLSHLVSYFSDIKFPSKFSTFAVHPDNAVHQSPDLIKIILFLVINIEAKYLDNYNPKKLKFV